MSASASASRALRVKNRNTRRPSNHKTVTTYEDSISPSIETHHSSEGCSLPEPPRKKAKRRESCSQANHAQQYQHHRIMTRSRSRVFPFMSLPPEIRNIIYEYTFARDEEVLLPELRLPTCLLTSRLFYIEARPIYFLSTPVTVNVRCNWCVRYHHLHSVSHHRFAQTGILQDLPIMLSEKGELAQRGVARFSTVKYLIDCCCCDSAKTIATMYVRMLPRDQIKKHPVLVVDDEHVLNPQKICPKIVDGLGKMFDHVKIAVGGIGGRSNFNGLSVEDLETVAKCFRGSESDSDLESEYA